MIDIATIGIAVDTKGLKAGQAELAKTERAANKTAGATSKVSEKFSALASSAKLMAGALAGVGIGMAVNNYIRLADTVTLIDARLRLATKGSVEFAQAQKDIYQISQRNSVGLAETASLYTKLSDPIRALGGNTSQVAAITEAFATSLKVSGASAAEASSATLQFAQAMGAGALRGDEFNSIAEANPRLLKALAAGMGVATGELREMAAAGQLTADVVGNALMGELETLRREGESIPLTVGAAMQQLSNTAMALVGSFDQVTGGSGALANLLVNVLNPAMKALFSIAIGVQQVFSTVGKTIAGVVGAVGAVMIGEFSQAKSILADMATDLSDNWTRAGAAISSAWEDTTAATTNTNTAVEKLNGNLLKTGKQSKAAAAAAAKLARELFDQEMAQFTAAEELYGAQIKLNREMREEQEKTAQATRDAYAEMVEARQDNAASLAEQIIKEQEAIAVMGLTRLELAELEAAKLSDAAASKERMAVIADEIDWSGQAGDAYRAEAAQLRELADLKRKGALKATSVDAAKDAAKEWQKTADKIEDTLTEALMRGFESGESFGENLGDSIVNTFKTYVAKEISATITKAIMSALANTQWGNALGSILGGASGGGGTDWISLALKGYQYMSGGSTAATAAAYGTTVGSQQTTMLMAQEAGMGTAAGGAGGSAAGIGALGWAAIIAAAIYAGSELYDAGYDRTNLQGVGESNRYDLGVENLLYKINEQTGLLNEKWANIMSGTTRMAHMLGYKLHQTGIRGNFDGAGGIQTDQYASYKGGWLRGSDKVFSAPLEAERAASLTRSLADIQDSTEVLVRSMGGNAQAVRDFAGGVTIDLRGLTQSEAAAKMAEEFQDLQFRMAEAAGISRDVFADMMAMAQGLGERFGATGPAIADLLVQGMTGRLSAGDLSAQLADVIMGGIYNSIASVYADPIAQMFQSQIIQPILTAALSGAPLAGIVSQATMQGVVNQARVSMQTLNQIFQDPAFKQFMSELEGTIKQVSSIAVQPAKHIKAFGTAALKTGVQVNTAQKEWEALANSIVDEIRRIRGEILGSAPDGLSNLQAQFATTTARARAGSQDAAEQLPGLSRELIELARETSLTMSDFRATQASTLDSLQDTAKQIAKKYKFKLPSFDVGTDYVPQDMVAMLHQGEKVTPKAYNKSGGDSSNAELVAESKAQRAVIVSMAATINRLEQGMSKLTSGYNVLRNQEVTA